MAEDEALTIRQVARLLNVNERTVRRYIDQGEFPNNFRLGSGPGAHWRIPKSDVNDFKKRYQQTMG